MELEELKNQWNLLSEQLKKNEIINHEAIKRMIEKQCRCPSESYP